MNDAVPESADQVDALGHPFREELVRIFRLPTVLVALLLSALAIWSLWDSMSDARGDRPGITIAIIAPGIFAAWVLISYLFHRKDASSLLARIVLGCLVVPVPIIVIAMIGISVVWFIPGNQEALQAAAEANHGFHYFWEDSSLGSFLLLYFFGGYAIAAAIGLGVVLIIMMPVTAIMAPSVAAAGSHLELVEKARFRDNLTAQLFVGLGLLCLGLIFTMMLAGGYDFADIPQWIDSLTRYEWSGYEPFDDRFDRGMTLLFFGTALIIAGIAFMISPIVETLRARSRAAKPSAASEQSDE